MSDDPPGHIIFSHLFHFLISLFSFVLNVLFFVQKELASHKKNSTRLARQRGPCPPTTDHSPLHLKETSKQSTNILSRKQGRKQTKSYKRKELNERVHQGLFVVNVVLRNFFSHRSFSWTPLQDCVPETTLLFCFFDRAFVPLTDPFIVSHVQLVSRVMLGIVFAVAQTKQLNERLVPTKTLMMARPTPKGHNEESKVKRWNWHTIAPFIAKGEIW